MSGQPYAAGGIRSTVEHTRAASDDELRADRVRTCPTSCTAAA